MFSRILSLTIIFVLAWSAVFAQCEDIPLGELSSVEGVVQKVSEEKIVVRERDSSDDVVFNIRIIANTIFNSFNSLEEINKNDNVLVDFEKLEDSLVAVTIFKIPEDAYSEGDNEEDDGDEEDNNEGYLDIFGDAN